jgi:alpha-1,2-mannosyltransferase
MRGWAGLIAVLALVARVVPVWRGGGLSATNGYDDGVYYAAATSLVHGQLPYRDYVLLHPPGSTLLLAPFALLARVTSDTAGFETARVAFMVLGAVNTVLVMVVAARIGRRVAVVAGLFYALFFPAILVARTVTLEELGTTTLLVALALLFRTDAAKRPTGAQAVLAGAALGVGATVKIWGVDPFVVVLVWQAIVAGRVVAARLLAGAVAAAVVLCLPFFAAAPSTMFRFVVRDQIGRPDGGGSIWSRLRDITGLRPLIQSWPTVLAYVFLMVVVVAVLAATVAALRRPQTRVFGALVLALGLVLLASPSFFDHYAAFTAAPLAIVVGASADRVPGDLAVRVPRPAFVVVAAALVAALAAPGVLRPQGVHVPRSLATAAAKVSGCVTADDPTVLVLMNAQSRDLRRHCRVWVDVTGITYDTADGRRPDNGRLDREADTLWQADIRTYLLSGSATIVSRPETDLAAANAAVIAALPPIFSRGLYVLRSTR